MKLRCRIGLHRWKRFKETDPDLEDRGPSAEWQTRCRDCQRVQGTGTVWATVAFVGVFVLALWCVLAGPPLLGAVLMIGAITGLLWSAGAVIGSRIVRWLSAGR
jgi:hypothetical protein